MTGSFPPLAGIDWIEALGDVVTRIVPYGFTAETDGRVRPWTA